MLLIIACLQQPTVLRCCIFDDWCFKGVCMVCRQRRGSKGPLSPRASGVLPPAEGVQSPPLSPRASGLAPTQEAGDVAVDINPETIGSGDIKPASSVGKRDSFMEAKFYDAKSTNLPVFGKRITDDDIIEGPMEAEPQVCCVVHSAA